MATATPRITAPTRSRFSKASRPSASARRCTSADRARPGCITWSTRSWTTRSTKRSPASATEVNVTIHSDNSVTVVDNGRGIPVDMHETGQVGRRGRPDRAPRRRQVRERRLQGLSGGLHGVGVSVVNALSETARVEIWRDGKVYQRATSAASPTATWSSRARRSAAARRSRSSPTRRSSRRPSSASTCWRAACASSRS